MSLSAEAPTSLRPPCSCGHAADALFAFRGEHEPKYTCFRHAMAHRPLLRTSILTALVVGTILTAINQGNILLQGEFPAVLAWKIPLTYSVPFMVSTWGALRISYVRAPRD